MQQENVKSEFRACLEKMQREQEEQQLALPYELTQDSSFNRQDPYQQFYRSLEETSKDGMLRKLGWKIVELQKEQEDLAFFCLSILSAQSVIPLNFFTNVAGGHMSLWMQVAVHLSPQYSSLQLAVDDMELRVYNFCRQRVVGLLQDFIRENINWGRMMRVDFSEDVLIERFKKEVIGVVNQFARKLLKKTEK